MTMDSVMLVIMHLSIGKLTDLFSIREALLYGLGFVFVSLVMVNSFTFFFSRSRKIN